ncbi:uncharacterized aarF domain-containing protein kinase At5g05200, chloroplastic-like [Hibiscus syriacus]|uniref:uncharacterized aarF domain-containing protein kinase At5g05200, chloroplastic-like n=1 Tax=Hibiscus syriacus TaxID=106335 RepID=UPI0019227014|nr:uncharacterized aarF domain-containing protein kinase At5g05200, chloroplastic-like [Hibiscus syriacus]
MSNNEGINFNMSGLGDGSDPLQFLIFQLHRFTVIASLTVSQIIGKPDLAPVVWVRKLVTLCDQAPTTPFDVVQLVLEKELGRSIGEVFEKLDVNPLGSASIAHVHRARLKGDVEDVVVKVQHPGVQDLMMTDICNLQAFSLYMQKTYIKFDLFSVTKEMEKHIGYEFDFLREANAMDRIRCFLYDNNRKSPVMVLRVLKDSVTRWRVLFMLFIIMNIFYCFLTDPGIFVALLDYGQVKDLSNQLRLGYANLVLAVADNDPVKANESYR